MARNNKVSKTDVKLIEKQDRCISLRRQGKTLQQIADAEGYKTEWGASKAIQAGLKRVIVPNIEEFRQEHKVEIDSMYKQLDKLASDILKKKTVSTEEAHLIARLTRDRIRLQERTAKLFGINAPENINITSEEPVDAVVVVPKKAE